MKVFRTEVADAQDVLDSIGESARAKFIRDTRDLWRRPSERKRYADRRHPRDALREDLESFHDQDSQQRNRALAGLSPRARLAAELEDAWR